MSRLDIPSTCQIPDLEALYQSVFGDVHVGGTFVEVGAYDGITYSNTWPLAKIGWNGLAIEPVFYHQCVGNHSKHNVRVINAVVGNGNVATFYTDKMELYTTDPNLAEALGAVFLYKEEVHTVSLDSLLHHYDMPPGFELLVIDVEGAELDVLSGFNLGHYRPRMVIIETHEKHENERLRVNSGDINTIFGEANYNKLYSDTINSVFVSPQV